MLLNLVTKEKKDISIGFGWTSDGLVEKMDADHKGNLLLHFGGRVTICRVGQDRLENATELKGD